MYMPGAEVDDKTSAFMNQLMFYMGIALVGHALKNECVLAAEDEEMNYFNVRQMAFHWALSLGAFVFQGTANASVGMPDPDPMHMTTFAMNFGMLVSPSHTFTSHEEGEDDGDDDVG